MVADGHLQRGGAISSIAGKLQPLFADSAPGPGNLYRREAGSIVMTVVFLSVTAAFV